jgi:SAM-dependent methyltransferase
MKEHSNSLFKRIISNSKAFLPFSRIDIVWRMVDKSSDSILDVGCGGGLPMKGVCGHKSFFTVGVDQSIYFVKKSKADHIHSEYVLCHANFLPFKEKSFDIVLCLEALYAQPKNECLNTINAIHNIARKQIIISERAGARPEDRDPWGCHVLSTWVAIDFEKMGFKVRGSHGLKLPALNNVLSKSDGLKYVFSYITGLPAYFLPEKAQNILCSKKVQ